MAKPRSPSLASLAREVRRLAVEVRELREAVEEIREDVDCLEMDSHDHDLDEVMDDSAA